MSVPSIEIVDRLIGHIQNRTTDLAPSELIIPAENFVSPSRAEAELALMRSLPLLVGRSSEIPSVGGFVTRDVLGTSLIIVREASGRVAAYVNMCRHRGGQVESEAHGSKRVFTCRYHGWAYNRDGGTLRTVPYEEAVGNLDLACNGLMAVAADERHGFIWITLAGDGRGSLSDYVGEQLDEQMASLGLAESVTYLEKSFTFDVNWKLVMDGANDPLHAKFLHPNGVGRFSTTNISAWEGYGRHGQSAVPRRKAQELVLAGESIEPTAAYVSAGLLIYPNNLIVTAPDHLEWWSVWPSLGNPSRSTTTIRFLVAPDRLDERMTTRMDKSWAILEDAALNEDWPMEATIQANAVANPKENFFYGLNEVSCQHLHRQLDEDLMSVRAVEPRDRMNDGSLARDD
jgi:phenylpropionate dioxygenase-like ring-hydroxylating dioxygenase large terminal subunit